MYIGNLHLTINYYYYYSTQVFSFESGSVIVNFDIFMKNGQAPVETSDIQSSVRNVVTGTDFSNTGITPDTTYQSTVIGETFIHFRALFIFARFILAPLFSHISFLRPFYIRTLHFRALFFSHIKSTRPFYIFAHFIFASLLYSHVSFSRPLYFRTFHFCAPFIFARFIFAPLFIFAYFRAEEICMLSSRTLEKCITIYL